MSQIKKWIVQLTPRALLMKTIFTCRELSQIAADKKSKGPIIRFRLYLHELICGPCRNYLAQIEQIDKSFLEACEGHHQDVDPERVEEFTKKLIQKYSKKTD